MWHTCICNIACGTIHILCASYHDPCREPLRGLRSSCPGRHHRSCPEHSRSLAPATTARQLIMKHNEPARSYRQGCFRCLPGVGLPPLGTSGPLKPEEPHDSQPFYGALPTLHGALPMEHCLPSDSESAFRALTMAVSSSAAPACLPTIYIPFACHMRAHDLTIMISPSSHPERHTKTKHLALEPSLSLHRLPLG